MSTLEDEVQKPPLKLLGRESKNTNADPFQEMQKLVQQHKWQVGCLILPYTGFN